MGKNFILILAAVVVGTFASHCLHEGRSECLNGTGQKEKYLICEKGEVLIKSCESGETCYQGSGKGILCAKA
ncbi:hypothetical protein BB561_002811 [Smittium simulii]|uniref:Carbohydrate-binding module family 19 domain-containing protein n=1 Tax=Smittium simulii TaxID=133385 RepID=A0A2T9YP27_9FUNG|nr:hypothetical protein BB561_002811 [Smittium simulii]